MKKIIIGMMFIFVLCFAMVSAEEYDFCDYPEPFVSEGVYNENNLFVVGDAAPASDTLAMVDVTTNLQYVTSSWVDSDSITVEGGVTEQVLLGDLLTDYFDSTIQDDEVATLLDSEISFEGIDYAVYEELQLSTSGLSVISNLGDEDTSEVYIQVTDVGYIDFYYKFDDLIDLSSTSSTYPLNVEFSGYDFEITSIDSDTGFSAYVGKTYYLYVDESVTINGKEVVLDDVSSSSVVISVDGTTEIISSSTAEVVDGVEITVDAVYSRTEREDSSANLVIKEYVLESFEDGDIFFSEDSGDLEWVWNLEYLTSVGTSQVFGFENNFIHDEYTDTGVAQEGDCLTLPNEYLEICLDSLTSDESYANVIIKGESTTVSSETTSAAVTPETALASEVTNPEDYNLFVFGNPCNNDLVEDIFGYTCTGWSLAEGESNLEVVENGDNYAVLIAGTTDDDTRYAAKALAKLAKEPIPYYVKAAYNNPDLEYGKNHIIPTPFNKEVLIWVSSAVAQAAIEDGVTDIKDFDIKEYQCHLRTMAYIDHDDPLLKECDI